MLFLQEGDEYTEKKQENIFRNILSWVWMCFSFYHLYLLKADSFMKYWYTRFEKGKKKAQLKETSS